MNTTCTKYSVQYGYGDLTSTILPCPPIVMMQIMRAQTWTGECDGIAFWSGIWKKKKVGKLFRTSVKV